MEIEIIGPGEYTKAVAKVIAEKNPAAQALAKLSHEKPPSEARKAASSANGKKGGRPKKIKPE